MNLKDGIDALAKENESELAKSQPKPAAKPSIDHSEIEKRKNETPAQSYARMQEQWRKERAALGDNNPVKPTKPDFEKDYVRLSDKAIALNSKGQKLSSADQKQYDAAKKQMSQMAKTNPQAVKPTKPNSTFDKLSSLNVGESVKGEKGEQLTLNKKTPTALTLNANGKPSPSINNPICVIGFGLFSFESPYCFKPSACSISKK